MDDARFTHVGRDPKFRSMPRKQKKVQIDERFNAMFKDKRFQLKYTVDKRGRPVNFSSSEDLKRYYDTNENNEDDESDDGPVEDNEASAESEEIVDGGSEDADGDMNADGDERVSASPAKDEQKSQRPENRLKSSSKQTMKKTRKKQDDKSAGNVQKNVTSQKKVDKQNKKEQQAQDLPELSEEEEPVANEVRSKLLDLAVDYARGGGVLAEDSSSDDESELEEAELEHDWAELDREAGRIDDSEITRRLAVCNMDWDRIKATDLMVLLHSFLPPGGVIQDVKIYPSEFGKKRMAEEEEHGPSEIINCKDGSAEVDNEKSSDDETPLKEMSEEVLERSQMEYIRKYQLSRLKYFYAIVTCDSPATATKLYEECEGLEFESSATRVDLRFVPDDMEFDEMARDVCTAVPEGGRYRPNHFVTTALQQRLVRFTWDETDPDRREAVRRIAEKGAEVDDADVRAYLADSADEEESGAESGSSGQDGGAVSEKDRIARYRALLLGDGDDEQKDEDNDVEMEVTWAGVGLKEKTEELVKKKEQERNLTPWEQYVDKQKQKKRDEKKRTKEAAKSEAASSKSDEDGDGSDVPSDLAEDPFFQEELEARRKEKKKMKKTKQKEKRDEAESDQDVNDEAQLSLLTMDDGEEGGRKHFNFKQIVKDEATATGKKKKKWKKKRKPAEEEAKVQDDFQVDVADPRFSKLFQSADFNLDPSDTRFKRTTGMERLVNEKQRRVAAGETTLLEPATKKPRTSESESADKAAEEETPGAKARQDDLGALVNNIKSRTKHVARKKQSSVKR